MSAKEVLTGWLQTHCDPGKDPWQDEILGHMEEKSISETDMVVIDPTYKKENELNDRLEGNCSLAWDNGDSFKGNYSSKGERTGWGIVSSSRQNILGITGNWDQGELEGKGRLVSERYVKNHKDVKK